MKTRLLFSILVVSVGVVGRCADIELEEPMWQDPKLQLPAPVKVYPKELTKLWLRALDRPEVDMKRMAAGTIAQAHKQGMTDLEETVEPLLRELDAADQHRAVRLAAAIALIELDARRSAPVLMKRANTTLEMQCLVETALARWDFQPMRDVWLERLSKPPPSQRQWMLAVDALGQVRESRAAKKLQSLMLSGESSTMRLAAARALARIRTTGSEADARTLAEIKTSRGIVDRLVAVSLLAEHESDAARDLLLELAVDSEPAVAGIAIEKLLKLEPTSVIPLAPRLLKNADGKVRELTCACLATEASAASINTLHPLLDDPHPRVRNLVRRTLLEFAEQDALKLPVIEAGRNVFADSNWRGLEQSIILLVTLDDKTIAKRLVKMLTASRVEVRIAAAWGLDKLAVPETLDGMLAVAKSETELYIKRKESFGSEAVVRRLFQTFGKMKHRRAENLMRKTYLAKKADFGMETRSAAAWALGYMYEGDDDQAVAKELMARIADTGTMPPEHLEVRYMSGISLGRMNSHSSLEQLKQWRDFDNVNSRSGYAFAWAVHQITGEPMPQHTPLVLPQTNWFLKPYSGSTVP